MESIDLIDAELIRVRDSFKVRLEDELRSLIKDPIKREYDVFGKKYPLEVWCEEDQDGTLNVIVELTKKHFLGSSTSFSQGFKLKEGEMENLTEQELWEFD